jgi:hypothetical protein
MNAKARKRAKRREARSAAQDQASQEHALTDEAAPDDADPQVAAAHEESTRTQEQRRRDRQYELRIASYMTHYADYMIKEDGEHKHDDGYCNEQQKFVGETRAVQEIMPILMAQVRAVVSSVRDDPKRKQFNLTWSLLPRYAKEAPHDGAPPQQGAVQNKVEPQLRDGGVSDAHASISDAVTTPHKPNPTYDELWESAVATARQNLPVDTTAEDIHEYAVNVFRTRKKRLKAKVKSVHAKTHGLVAKRSE